MSGLHHHTTEILSEKSKMPKFRGISDFNAEMTSSATCSRLNRKRCDHDLRNSRARLETSGAVYKQQYVATEIKAPESPPAIEAASSHHLRSNLTQYAPLSIHVAVYLLLPFSSPVCSHELSLRVRASRCRVNTIAFSNSRSRPRHRRWF